MNGKEREMEVLTNVMEECLDYYSVGSITTAANIILLCDFNGTEAIKYFIENYIPHPYSATFIGEIASVLTNFEIRVAKFTREGKKESQPADRFTISQGVVSIPNTSKTEIPYGSRYKLGEKKDAARHVYRTFDGDISSIVSISEMTARKYYNDALRAANGNRLVAIDYLHSMIATKIEEIKMITTAIEDLV